jgi:CheY-like chemotaxis protein/HPt (histidine-containing phosphotransfer) domain-containing protein
MNAIIGLTELALRDGDSESVRTHLLTVKQAAVNLLSIINDILDFSRLEAGAMQVVARKYMLSSLLNDVISIVRMRMIDSPLRFVVNVDSNLPNELIGDELRIRQVLINILENSVKYTEKGFIAFAVSGVITDDSSILLTLEVRDSGRGIKQEDLDKLFSEFIRVDTEFSSNIQGVGLGLPITRSLVVAMGGDITVESVYGTGSTFTVTLPQEIHNHNRIASVTSPERKNVLIFDRREAYADSLASTLSNLGVSFEIATSAAELYELTEKNKFSNVFISYPLYCEYKDVFDGSRAIITHLTEFGETVPDKSMHSLAMPVHAISIANTLNGVADSFSYSYGSEPTVRIEAPGARVLVVDDIKTNLMVANGLLAPYKMQVDLCDGGAQAVELAAANRYDMIFMDHRMPNVDGIEAMRRIRKMGASDRYYYRLPIVALTANAVAGMRELFLDNGFSDFIPKPIDTIRLNEVLEQWLPKSKQERSSGDPPGAAAGDAAANGQANLGIVAICGVDAAKGVVLSGGNASIYYETLRVFCDDARERMIQIKGILEEHDLDLYTTTVHALKGASANVGADEISAAAFALEMAGQRGDQAYIDEHNDAFLAALGKLAADIAAALPSAGADNDKASDPIQVQQFLAGLASLKTALEGMDINAIDQYVNSLMASDLASEEETSVRSIAKLVLLGDYDEAITLIDSILSQGDNQ